MPSVTSNISSIGQLIRLPAIISVPDYQRDYSWTQVEVEQLWNDLFLLREERREEHFMGAIVLNAQEADKLSIVDGQQRLATVFILISALRLRARELGDDDLAETLNAKFGEKDIRTRQVGPRIRLNELDDPFFREWVIEQSSSDKIRAKLREKSLQASHRLMLVAFSFFISKLEEINSPADFSDLCAFLIEAIDAKLIVIKIEVSNEESAYWLFETLNDRGLELSVVDLIKNFVLRQSGRYRVEAKQRWNELVQSLGRATLTGFIRHYWMSRFGVIREKDLFREIGRTYSDPHKIKLFLDELAAVAEPYAALHNDAHPYWDRYDEPMRGQLVDFVAELNLFRNTQSFPVLLAALEVCADAEKLVRNFRVVTTVAVRASIATAGRGSGSVEKSYSDAALALRRRPSMTRDDLIEALRGINPSNEEFRSACQTLEIRNLRLSRHVLNRIINLTQAVGDLARSRTHTVEHILPVRPTPEWKAAFGEEASEYVHRLGNLLILERNLNKAAGRKL